MSYKNALSNFKFGEICKRQKSSNAAEMLWYQLPHHIFAQKLNNYFFNAQNPNWEFADPYEYSHSV